MARFDPCGVDALRAEHVEHDRLRARRLVAEHVGGTNGCTGACRRCLVASVHLRHLNPLPPDLGQILRQYRRVLVPEINAGQLVRVLRAEYLVDAVGFNRVRGLPLASDEIYEAINQLLGSHS